LNQTKRYWLLLDALIISFSIYRLHRDYQAWAPQKPPQMCGEFEIKLEILYGRIGLEVINFLKPFLAFVVFFNVISLHLFVWSPT
jgi:hypothetical protein